MPVQVLLGMRRDPRSLRARGRQRLGVARLGHRELARTHASPGLGHRELALADGRAWGDIGRGMRDRPSRPSEGVSTARIPISHNSWLAALRSADLVLIENDFQFQEDTNVDLSRNNINFK